MQVCLRTQSKNWVMAVCAPLSKRDISIENRKTSDAHRAAAKPKAKANVKAKAQPKKAQAIVILSSKYFSKDLCISEDEWAFDSSQTR